MSQDSQRTEQTAKMAGLVGQIGCVTGFVSIIIIGIAFAAGRFLDSTFETGGIFTVLFLLGSFPITLYAIVRISLAAVARAQQPAGQKQTENKEVQTTTEEDTQT